MKKIKFKKLTDPNADVVLRIDHIKLHIAQHGFRRRIRTENRIRSCIRQLYYQISTIKSINKNYL